MSDDQVLKGTILSSTVIRVPGAMHASSAPFVLLLVEVEGGRHLLGHYDSEAAPAIGARVIARPIQNTTLNFRPIESY